MARYANKSGNSGVRGYRMEEQAIAVTFDGGETYLYTWKIPGKKHVEAMKKLAEKGEGLSTYISREVKGKFERKIDA